MGERGEKDALLLEINHVFPQHFGFFQLVNITPAKEYGGNLELPLPVRGMEENRWVKGENGRLKTAIKEPSSNQGTSSANPLRCLKQCSTSGKYPEQH